jgi:chemotaxis regulatin CheY-phosphate phosphatase CheZ
VSDRQGPDIILEFDGGVMTIRTEKAVYQVSVSTLDQGARVLPPASDQPALPGMERPAAAQRRELPSGETAPALAPPAADYYSELSHDLFRELGNLARRLATSLKKLARGGGKGPDAGELGQEMAAAQEKARGLVESLKEAAEEQREAAAQRRKLLAALGKSNKPGTNPLAPLATGAKKLLSEVVRARVQNGQAAGYRFGLDSVFQGIYDHCSNQTVRKHIQTMWDDLDAFDGRLVEQLLNQAAPAEPPPGGLVRLQLTRVLAALEQSTGNQRYQQILSKMQATAGQLFPDGNLYVEAEVLGPAAAGPDPALLERVEDFLGRVAAAARRAGPALPLELTEIMNALGEQEPRQELDQAKSLGELERHLGGLNEMLSGLPAAAARSGGGQLRLMGEVLLQLLSLLVGLRAKLVAKESDPTVNAFQAEQKAQAEVEAALAGLELPDGEGQAPIPDPKKVDRLLESLGF